MTNSLFNGTPRSTPSFYPSRPDNWRLASGPLNGYGTVAEGRKEEIALDVKQFAPFVSAGWNLEEKNIRPAQWLALLKSLVMLGADFFHVGYFNVTGTTGWPNGKGPNDPRGYIYQIAMPAYAQALASHTWEFLEKGVLLEDPLSKKSRMPFAFAASAPNHLVLVRKWKNQYLIFGSVQPNSNYQGNTPLEANTSIILEGHKIMFKIRRQGSMYIYNPSAKEAVFCQLDGWHQYEHPWYWKKSVEMEAENLEGVDSLSIITTRTASTESDFTNFDTYVRLEPGQVLSVSIPGKRTQTLFLSLIIKKETGNPIVRLKTKSGEIRKVVNMIENNRIILTEEELIMLQLKTSELLSLTVENGKVLIDKLVF